MAEPACQSQPVAKGEHTRVSADPLLPAYFENAPFGLVLVKRDRRLTYANPALCRLLERSAEELAAIPFDELTAHSDRSANVDLFEGLFDGRRQGYVLEKRYLRKTAQPVWVRVTCTRVDTPEGTRALGVIEDISELMKERRARADATEALARQVRHLHVLHDTTRMLADHARSPDVLEATVKRLSTAFEAPGGVQLKVGPWSASAGPLTGTLAVACDFETNEGPGTLSFFTDGWNLALDEEQLIGSVVEVVRAELDRRAALAKVASERERLDRALTLGHMGVWELDVPTMRVTMSEHLARMVGRDGEIRMSFAEVGSFAHPDDGARLRARFETLMRAPPTVTRMRHETRLRAGDGSYRRVQGSARLIRDEHGAPARIIAMAADVTAARALEDSQRQSQKLRVIAQLTNTLATEFEEVLTESEVSVAKLEQLTSDETSREVLSDVRQMMTRGVALAGKLRAYGQPDAPKSLVDVTAAVKSLVPVLSRVCGSRVKVKSSLEPGCVALVETLGLEQAVLNLVVNARDATPAEGEVLVTVAHRANEVAISVKDRGVGMPPDVVRRLSEPFFTTKEPGRGTGLGLTAVYGLASRCGGRVEVDSAVGQGSTFTLVLPKGES